MDTISSPCRNVCNLDSRGQHCQTCKRSLDEIARWGSMSEGQRKAIMAILPLRRIDATAD